MSFEFSQVIDAIGGQGHIDIYLVRPKSDSSDYDFLDPSAIITSPTYPASPSLPVVASPTTSNVLYSLTLIGDHKVSIDSKGYPSVDSIDNYEAGEAFFKSIFKIAKPKLRQRPEYFTEDHRRMGGNIYPDRLVLMYCYGHVDSITNKVYTEIVLGCLSVTTSGEHKDEQNVKPDIKLIGTIPISNITLPAATFNSSLVTVASPKTLYKNNIYYEEFLPAGALAV